FASSAVAEKSIKPAHQNIVGNSFHNISEAIQDSDRIISAFKKYYNLPSLVIGVSAKGGKNLWSKAYGYADLENRVPAKVSTKYRLGSVSKTFTSGLIGTLV